MNFKKLMIAGIVIILGAIIYSAVSYKTIKIDTIEIQKKKKKVAG